ncbi:MAG TPA: NFACT family protein, partial [Ktedonobacterales bacterium]
MYVDALALAALKDELREAVLGGRVDDVIQPTPHAIALQVYAHGQNRWLLISAHPQYARIHLVEQKPRKLVAEPPTFVMLLRKYLEGARITELRQPPWERILEFAFAHGSSTGESAAPVWLVVEVMGKLSNIILRDDQNIILGALHHVSPQVNHYRTILPHVEYRYPPQQTRRLGDAEAPRLSPEAVTAEELRQAAEEYGARPRRAPGKKGSDASVAGLLAEQMAGFSRDLVAEAAFRALATAAAPVQPETDWDRVASAVRELARIRDTHEWRPTLVYAQPDAQRPE